MKKSKAKSNKLSRIKVHINEFGVTFASSDFDIEVINSIFCGEIGSLVIELRPKKLSNTK